MYQEIYPKRCIKKSIPRDVLRNPSLGMYQEIHPRDVSKSSSPFGDNDIDNLVHIVVIHIASKHGLSPNLDF